MKTRLLALLTCFILTTPLIIWIYYQFSHPPPQSLESDDDLITLTQARDIAHAYLEAAQIYSIDLIPYSPTRYRIFMTREGNEYGLYVNAENGTVNFFQPTATELENFPTIQIQTLGDDEPFVERTLWIDSEFELEGFTDLSPTTPEIGRIRGRGNSTWNMRPDKRPLRLRFETEKNFFGEQAIANDWILLADAGDRSLLRNYSVLHLARRLPGLNWTPSARHIHLYVNDEYQGVYLLTEERSLAYQHLEIAAHAEPQLSEYFFEMEWRADRDDRDETNFVRVNSHPFGVVGDSSAEAGFDRDFLYEVIYPEEILTDAHMEYLRVFLTEIGTLIRQGDFETISRRVDLNSLIDFYLIQELYKNIDAGFSSVFLQIRGLGVNRRLYHGPIWDFDIAAGNAYWMGAMNQTPLGGLYVAERFYWYWYLMHMPEFVNLLTYRWNSIVRNEALLMIEHIERLADIHQEEFDRNFDKHDVLGLDKWPSPEHINEIQTFQGHVSFLTEFLTTRVQYLDDIFQGNRPMWRW